jgi:hypothetical protein
LHLLPVSPDRSQDNERPGSGISEIMIAMITNRIPLSLVIPIAAASTRTIAAAIVVIK